MDLGIKGKVALVLAASKGLGRASAAVLAAEGVQVVIGSRNRQVLEKTAQEIQQASGSRVLAFPTDVTKQEELEAIVTTTVQEYFAFALVFRTIAQELASIVVSACYSKARNIMHLGAIEDQKTGMFPHHSTQKAIHSNTLCVIRPEEYSICTSAYLVFRVITGSR